MPNRTRIYIGARMWSSTSNASGACSPRSRARSSVDCGLPGAFGAEVGTSLQALLTAARQGNGQVQHRWTVGSGDLAGHLGRVSAQVAGQAPGVGRRRLRVEAGERHVGEQGFQVGPPAVDVGYACAGWTSPTVKLP